MRLQQQREAIVRVAQRCVTDGLIVGTSGNLSVAAEDLIAVTPSGLPYERMTAADVVLLDHDGTLVDGRLLPTSEWQLHLAVHQAGAVGGTPSGAIVHTHSPYVAAVSTLLEELPAIHYYVTLLGGPPRVAPYATFGTRELADLVVAALKDRTAAIMGSHGAIAVGATLEQAHERAAILEWLCQVWCIAQGAGEPRLLTSVELGDVERRIAELVAERDAMPGWGDGPTPPA